MNHECSIRRLILGNKIKQVQCQCDQKDNGFISFVPNEADDETLIKDLEIEIGASDWSEVVEISSDIPLVGSIVEMIQKTQQRLTI